MSEVQVNVRVAQCVDRIGDPLLKHIRHALSDVAPDVVDAVVQAMCYCGVLRQKEDSYDHDWCYVLTRYGSECYQDVIPQLGKEG